MVPDIERNGHVFTDGCGFMGRELAKKLAKASSPSFSGTPSVIQIRFLGFKGVCTVNSKTPDMSFELRPSMEKFRGSDVLNTVLVVGMSRPYKFGHLNLQYVMLLAALGVPHEHLLEVNTF